MPSCKCTLFFLGLSFVAGPALAEDLPVIVSPDAISSTPKVRVQDEPAARLWMIGWPRDGAERSLNMVVVKPHPGIDAINETDPSVMYRISFKEGLGEDRAEADVREEGSGESEIWGGTARWLLGSELAERAPVDLAAFLANNSNTAKAPRGPERRYCLSFAWLAADVSRSMNGAYCRVLPPSEVPTAADMLSDLELSFR